MASRNLGVRLADRANTLNLVRLALAVAVIVSHAGPIIGIFEYPLSSIGAVAVNGFFTVSGYLVAGSRVSASWRGFMWRRCIRIFPALVVCASATAVVLGPIAASVAGTRYSWGSAWDYVWNVSLLTNRVWGIQGSLTDVPSPGNWAGAVWTLQFEFLAYIAIGLLLSIPLARRYGKIVVPLLSVGAVAVYALAVHVLHVHTNFFLQSMRLGSFFLVGSALYFLRDRVTVRPLCIAAAGVIYGVLVAAGLDWGFGQLPLAYLLLGVGSHPLRNYTTANDLSYGTYIYAFPIAQTLVVFGSASWGLILNLLLTTAATAGTAWLSWRFIELPTMKLKKLIGGPPRVVHTPSLDRVSP